MSPACALIIEVRIPGGRFHGTRRTDSTRRSGGAVDTEEWPPSPLRLFQALVAASYGGRWAAEPAGKKDAALAWLEALSPPVVASPRALTLRPVAYFVPNNDLDAFGGDPANAAEVRVRKTLRTSLFDSGQAIVYAWRFVGTTEHADCIVALADRLHTLGHGVDQAFAMAVVVAGEQVEPRLEIVAGDIARPSDAAPGADGVPCPAPGSLDSLKARHRAASARFRPAGSGRQSLLEFRQPPRVHGRAVAYGSRPGQLVFELRDADRPLEFRPWPQSESAALVKALRDLVLVRLAVATDPARQVAVQRVVAGRGIPTPQAPERIRFVPLPSIGTRYTSPSIRRVLIQIPAGLALEVADLQWALSGRVFGGEPDADGVLGGQTLLAAAEDDGMAGHYTGPSRLWQSITPIVLPERCRPAGDSGQRQADLQARAAGALVQALRHAGVGAKPLAIRIQSEPFRGRGLLADQYGGDRFDRQRMTHAEVHFDRPVAGPLLIGDGRWLGLGLMTPVQQPVPAIHAFVIDDAGPAAVRSYEVTRAMRRAVMARVQAVLGNATALPLFFSGHQADGSPACGDGHHHLYYVADDANGDGYLDRIVVIAPVVPTPDRASRKHLKVLADAVAGMVRLRIGTEVVGLRAADILASDGLFGGSRQWLSRTPYRPSRQPKRDVHSALEDDVRLECRRHGLPQPTGIEVLEILTGRRGRTSARLGISFVTNVAGPVLLGDGAHFGRSLFEHGSKG